MGLVLGWLIPADPGQERAIKGDPTVMKTVIQSGRYRVTVDLAIDEHCTIEIHDMIEDRTFPIFRDHISHMLVPAD